MVSDSEVRKAQLQADTAAETVQQAKAVYEAALAQRSYTSLVSPIDGYVVSRLSRSGDLAVPGVPILVLESNRQLIFEATLPGKFIDQVEQQQQVMVQLDGINEPLVGTLTHIVRSGDKVTRSYPVRISLSHAKLKAGMFGRAIFELGEDPIPTVPTSALVKRGGLTGVYVINPQQQANFRWLRLGREWQGKVEVTSGIDAASRLWQVCQASSMKAMRLLRGHNARHSTPVVCGYAN